MVTELWVVGKNLDEAPDGRNIWAIVGVYDSEKKALAACISWQHFLGPIELNNTLPDYAQEWTGMRYPIPHPELAKQ